MADTPFSALPVVAAGSVTPAADYFPLVSASNTSRMFFHELRALMSGGFINIKDPPYNAVGDSVADDTAAIQQALNDLDPNYGGYLVIPNGRYRITSSIVLPADTVDGRTLQIVGLGEAILHNQAPANNPTFKMLGASGSFVAKNLKIRDLIFTGEVGFPNHGIHLRWAFSSEIEGCIFCMHGSGIYTDGGLGLWVMRNLQFWPSGDRHRSPTTHTGSSAIQFDTPVLNAEYAHTMTFDDIVVEAGGRGIELKTGYVSYGWRIGRLTCEGLTGGNGWGIDLNGLLGAEIGPLYTEFNTPGTMGDANDLQMRLSNCERITVLGGYGSGKIELRNTEDVILQAVNCNKLDADSSNTRLTLIGLRHSAAGGAGAGYTNNAVDKVEIGVKGVAGSNNLRLWGGTQFVPGTNQMLRGTSLTTGAGDTDDVRAKNSAIRWENNAQTTTQQRFGHLVNQVAVDGDWDLSIRPYAFFFILSANNGEGGLFFVRGSYNTSSELLDPLGVFSNTKDTAGMINVYHDAGTSSYHIQNKSGNALEIVVFIMAAN